MRTRRMLLMSFGIVVVCLLLLASVKIYSDQTRQRAEHVLAQVRSIRVGQSFDPLKQSISLQNTGQFVCSDNRCSMESEFTNSWLSKLRLAPPTLFRVNVASEGDRVISLQVGEYIDQQASASTTEGSIGYGPEPPCAPHRRETRFGEPWRVVIFVTPSCSGEQIERAYAYNLACLSKLGGCKNARDLLPGAW
jgi:hypothetical protein